MTRKIIKKKKKGAHLPTILSFDSSLGLAHVERGVIHPGGKEGERSVNHCMCCCCFFFYERQFDKSLPKATLTPRNLHAPWTVCPVNAVFSHPSLLSTCLFSRASLEEMFFFGCCCCCCCFSHDPARRTAERELMRGACPPVELASQTDVYSSLSCRLAEPSVLWLERTRASGREQASDSRVACTSTKSGN